MLLLAALLPLSGCQSLGEPGNTTRTGADLERSVDLALQRLYASEPSARALASRATGILVFPGVVRAGFIGGGKFGNGALRQQGKTTGYYNVVAGSYGLQAGMQTYDYTMFFMTPKALDYLRTSGGWEIGTGPTLVVVDAGVANNMTTSTLKSDIYAYVSTQKGLMAGLGLQGTKITRITQ
jgi:lipid-binding SYLF domain-containing protein